MADFFASWYLGSAWCSRTWPLFIPLETLPVGLLVLIMSHGLQGRPLASATNLVCYCFFDFFSHGNNVEQLSCILICSYSSFFFSHGIYVEHLSSIRICSYSSFTPYRNNVEHLSCIHVRLYSFFHFS